MTPVQTFAAAVKANLAASQAALTGIAAGIVNLDTLITNFQNSPGTLSPADQQSLDDIQTASQALLAQAQAISTTPPGTTVPVVPVPPPTPPTP